MVTFSLSIPRDGEPGIPSKRRTPIHMTGQGTGRGFFILVYQPIGFFCMRMESGSPQSDSIRKLQKHMSVRGKR